MLEDIAVLTGGEVITEELGLPDDDAQQQKDGDDEGADHADTTGLSGGIIAPTLRIAASKDIMRRRSLCASS